MPDRNGIHPEVGARVRWYIGADLLRLATVVDTSAADRNLYTIAQAPQTSAVGTVVV